VRRLLTLALLLLASSAGAQFSIPNYPTASYAAQAAPDHGDFDALVAADRGNGVVSGAACTAQASPDMTVAVSAGATVFNYTTSAVTGGNATITAADGTNPRFDIIVSSAGTKNVRAGTAAANPVFPDLTAGDVPLCAVYVPASIGTIDSTRIVDKRVFIAGFKGVSFWASGSSYTVPIGARMLVIECVGGGAGGGGVTGVASQTATGGGGGGGSYSMAILSGSLSTTYSYSIGAAANGGSAGNNGGTAGNDTTFNTTTCVGKGGGAGGGQAASATAKGSGTPGVGGVAGTGSVMTTVGIPAPPGWSGGAAGVMGSSGGNSFFGSGAAAVTVAAAGNNAAGCGGGGSGGASTAAVNRAGGNGAAGCIRITEIY
jgi:hypothetical protein